MVLTRFHNNCDNRFGILSVNSLKTWYNLRMLDNRTLCSYENIPQNEGQFCLLSRFVVSQLSHASHTALWRQVASFANMVNFNPSMDK